jgi:hypothetical protein
MAQAAGESVARRRMSNIVAMLILFRIQNTQNRNTAALQLKLDELLRAVDGAHNAFILAPESGSNHIAALAVAPKLVLAFAESRCYY